MSDLTELDHTGARAIIAGNMVDGAIRAGISSEHAGLGGASGSQSAELIDCDVGDRYIRVLVNHRQEGDNSDWTTA